MILIQIVLIGLVLIVATYFATHRGASRVQAGMKLVLMAFAGVSVVSILFPDLVTKVANWFGVGRGADLLLYGMIVMFVFTVLATYLSFRERKVEMARLTRQQVLLEKRIEELEAKRQQSS